MTKWHSFLKRNGFREETVTKVNFTDKTNKSLNTIAFRLLNIGAHKSTPAPNPRQSIALPGERLPSRGGTDGRISSTDTGTNLQPVLFVGSVH